MKLRSLVFLVPLAVFAEPVPLDLSGVKPGPVTVAREGDMAVVRWPDSSNRTWEASFNLEPARPLIASIKAGDKLVIQNAVPMYSGQTGKRRGGFDEFFDFPPSHPEGTRSFDGVMAVPKPGVALLATRTAAPVVPVGISGTDVLLGREQRLPRVGSPIALRVGRPFHLIIPQGVDRRTALAAADVELMRRIAALVEPRHRGTWEPWPDT